jgi:hypothetical protein
VVQAGVVALDGQLAARTVDGVAEEGQLGAGQRLLAQLLEALDELLAPLGADELVERGGRALGAHAVVVPALYVLELRLQLGELVAGATRLALDGVDARVPGELYHADDHHHEE